MQIVGDENMLKYLIQKGYVNVNKLLLERYKLLDSSIISNIQKHREKQYFLASNDAFNFILI